MKKLLFLFILFPIFGYSQKSDTTYYDNTEDQGSFPFSFAIPALTYSKIADKNTLSVGGSVNIYINKHWYVGIFGEIMALGQNKTIKIDTILYENLKLNYGYLGPMVGYIFFPDKKVSIYTSLRYGIGSVSLSSDKSGTTDNFSVTTVKVLSDNSTIFIPNVDFIYNVLPSLKLSASVGYKCNFGINNIAYTNKSFNSPYISLSLLFGIFPE